MQGEQKRGKKGRRKQYLNTNHHNPFHQGMTTDSCAPWLLVWVVGLPFKPLSMPISISCMKLSCVIPVPHPQLTGTRSRAANPQWHGWSRSPRGCWHLPGRCCRLWSQPHYCWALPSSVQGTQRVRAGRHPRARPPARTGWRRHQARTRGFCRSPAHCRAQLQPG